MQAVSSRQRVPELPVRIYRSNIRGKVDGWRAHIRLLGVSTERYFADDKYGGRDEAFEAARLYADENISLHLELLSIQRRLIRRANCRSGVPGVARYDLPGRGPFWLAFWDDADGRKRSRRFAIGDLGEEGARSAAVETRRKIDRGYEERLLALCTLLGVEVPTFEVSKRRATK